MFLIEYKAGWFVDGERIDWISVVGNLVQFTVAGDIEDSYVVDKKLNSMFLNHLNALNNNINPVKIITSANEDESEIDIKGDIN